jgi:hypothetical protein
MVVSDAKLKRQRIAVGLGDGHDTEVKEGLDGSETVVAALDSSMADGEPVNTVVKELAGHESSSIAAKNR